LSYNNVDNYLEQGGSTWKIGGQLDIISGGAQTVESGGTLTVESGGVANIDSGGKLTVDSGGQILFGAGAKLSHAITAASSAQTLSLPGVYQINGTSTWVDDVITLPAPTTNGEFFEFFAKIPTSTASVAITSTGPNIVNFLGGAGVVIKLFGGGYAKLQAMGSTCWGAVITACSSGSYVVA